MAAITLPTSVKPTANTKFAPIGQLGATGVVGNTLYQDVGDSKWKLCDANSTLPAGTLKGLLFTAGVANDYCLVAIGGSVILVGSTMIVGETYAPGQTGGSIVPIGDLTTGDYVNHLGAAGSVEQIDLNIKAFGTVHA